MCGIAGIINLDGKCVKANEIISMTQSLAHRGPDDEGYTIIDQNSGKCTVCSGANSDERIKNKLPFLKYEQKKANGNIALGHRRFSIVDLSVDAHQPFLDREKTHCLIFNGEIYNYLDIKKELISKGIRFYTKSDTEVFLEAFKKWGTDCFNKFNGFWVAAIYSFRDRKLFLCKDRLGKKPLYWNITGSTIYFASEIKALLCIADIYNKKQVNELVAYQWLSYGRKDFNDETFFKNIFSFPAAHWAVVNKEFPKNISRYWEVPMKRLSEKNISIREATSKLRDILENSVKIRLQADVPVAISLSGGMDSSSIAALASVKSGNKFSSYTVRFDDPKWNEEPFANLVAKQYNLDYHILESPVSNFWKQIIPFTYLEEEPYHAPNVQTSQEIWIQMRETGIKVSLGGAGGDELFAGYGNYFKLAQFELFREKELKLLLNNFLRYSERNKLPGRVMKLFYGCLKKNINKKEKKSYLLNLKYSPNVFQANALSQALYSDITETLMPYWFAAGDRGCMGVPLETRAPFLDYRMVEFAFQLPISYLIRDGWHKWILRKAFEDLLPKEVVWRKNKLGFPFPFEQFYSDNRKIFEVIKKKSSNPFIDLSKWNMFQHDWKVISFILWYEMFFNKNVSLLKDIQEIAMNMETTVTKQSKYSSAFLKTNILFGNQEF